MASSTLLEEYLSSVAAQNENSAKTYRVRLLNFQKYLASKETPLTVDEAIEKCKKKEIDPYTLCADFAAYILKQGRAPYYQSQIMKTTKNLLVYHDVEISDHKFRLKVRLKKVVKRKKLGLSIDDVRTILKGCNKDPRLFTYVLFLAGTGCRAAEALAIQNKHLHLGDERQPYVHILGENTKTGADRDVYLTSELVRELEDYLKWKYRERRTMYDYKKGQRKHAPFIPEKSDDDLLFQPYHHEGQEPTAIKNLYVDLSVRLVRVLKKLEMADREDHNSRRHKITFHSFRRFVKTTISDLGYADFSEFFIGHAGSSYWTKPEREKIELFKKVEPYLTFLDVTKLEASGQAAQAQIDSLQKQVLDMSAKLNSYDWFLERVEHDTRVAGIISELEQGNDDPENKTFKRLVELVKSLQKFKSDNRKWQEIEPTLTAMTKKWEEEHKPLLERLRKEEEGKTRQRQT